MIQDFNTITSEREQGRTVAAMSFEPELRTRQVSATPLLRAPTNLEIAPNIVRMRDPYFCHELI